MINGSFFARVSRSLQFGRHIPLRKLFRRVELSAQRALRDGASPANNSSPLVRRAVQSPLPLFSPRIGIAPTIAKGLHFSFLNRSVTMYGPGIDWTAPGPEAEHQLWRMNLHYMEYLEGVDDPSWIMFVSDWIESNPASRRGVWRDSWNSYALSLRVVVWMQELARRWKALSVQFVESVEASIVSQIVFLERNIETDLGGNHLIKNIKALLWASAYFQGPAAERWRAKALRLLKKELTVQVLPDGMHYERSPSYHAQVFADLLECRHVLLGDPFGGVLDDVLARMAQVTADLQHPDGHSALFNDAGLNMAYQPGECLGVYERMFGRRISSRSVFALSQAGYYGMRSGDDYFIIDCGRIAPDDLPAHGHGDVLSFEWSVAGKRIIVDPGVLEYIAGENRDASRTAATHNTLCLEGADQADFFGAFRCGRRPNVELQRWEPGTHGFVLEGSHDGFAHHKGHPRHVRYIDVRANEILIRDSVEASAEWCARISLLLHPEVVTKKTLEGFELHREGICIRLSATFELNTIPAVWWPDMGCELETLRVVGYLTHNESAGSMSLQIISRGAAAG